MTFKFFTFPETNTTSCKLIFDGELSHPAAEELSDEDEKLETEKIKANHRYTLERETPDNTEMNQDDQKA